MLAKKELRLQQMTFAMVAVYALIWTGLTVAGELNVDFAREFPMRGVGLLYFALLPLLMGSLASAQERQAPVQPLSQQTPSTQWLPRHSLLLMQTLPRVRRPQFPLTHATPAAQLASVAHDCVQAPAAHRYGLQSWRPGDRQVPSPSHVPAVLSSALVAHDGALHWTVSGAMLQPPRPSQVPV